MFLGYPELTMKILGTERINSSQGLRMPLMITEVSRDPDHDPRLWGIIRGFIPPSRRWDPSLIGL